MRIALLEDEAEQAERISRLLEGAGHHVHTFARGAALLSSLRSETFDLVILDWEVPGLSGLDVLRSIRTRVGPPMPVLFLTHRDSETDVVAALQAGADDFLIKPARDRELLARLEAVARRMRAATQPADVIDATPFRIDASRQRIERDGQPLELTPREYDVALLLFRNLGRPLSRAHIMDQVWGRGDDIPTRTMDTHMSRIRTRLNLRPEHGFRLSPLYGYGYRLERIEEFDAASLPA